MTAQRFFYQCYHRSNLFTNPLSTLILTHWTLQWLSLHCLFFLSTGLVTYGNFIRTSFKNFKQWLGVTFQLSEAVSTHSQIIDPKVKEVLWFCGFLGNGIIQFANDVLDSQLGYNNYELLHRRNLCCRLSTPKDFLVLYLGIHVVLCSPRFQPKRLDMLLNHPIHFD